MTQKSPTTQTIIKRTILVIVAIASVVGLFVSISSILKWRLDTSKNTEIKERIIKESTSEEAETKESKIDFAKLKSQNEDTVAYLKIESLNIDYPIVKTANNSYYLNYNFDKEYNIAGWPFADYHNKFDGTDKNIIIYGHNSHDDQMFSLLYKTQEESWQADPFNQIINFSTPEGNYKYQIFSTYTIDPEEYYITTDFPDDTSYEQFLNTIKSRSNHDYGTNLTKDDTILTLSSCTPDAKNRIVVHAKML